MTAPHEDTPAWDERHDGYSIDQERSVVVRREDRQMLRISAALAGLRIEALMIDAVVIVHGASHTLEILEALHGVVSESLSRERKLQQG